MKDLDRPYGGFFHPEIFPDFVLSQGGFESRLLLKSEEGVIQKVYHLKGVTINYTAYFPDSVNLRLIGDPSALDDLMTLMK